MNHGGRRGSRGRSQTPGQWVIRQKSETPVIGDKPLDESSSSRGRGSRWRGRSSTSFSPVNTSLSGNHERVYVKKSIPVVDVGLEAKSVQQQINSIEVETGPTKTQSAVKILGDDKDILQSSTLSSSKNVNLSGVSVVSRECEDKDANDGARMRSDLVNRMKDVSFSSQDSVSSTSAQKVDLLSVEDHNCAQKSGSPGNSSNESSKRPFDIVLEKKGYQLKPSTLVLNRANKKEATGYKGTVIRPGMVLLKNYLSINDQVMVVKKCRELGLGKGGFYQPGYRDGALLHLNMMCLGKNWDPQTSQYGETRPLDGSVPPQIPSEFSLLVEKAVKESQSVVATNSKKMNGEDAIPHMSPDICIVNFYTSTGRLGLHQDKDESEKSIREGLPVVSFSIGDSAEFLYGDQRDSESAEMVVLESGDVLLFGGKSRNIYHGVRSILKDTAPKILVQQTSLRPGRLNLTFRKY